MNCTEVFPIEDGDQIIDVAQGYFYTIVVTEQGYAYAVGHDKYRSYYESNLHARTPAYQIELPGRATKCWGTKANSVAFIEVEDAAGEKKYYSGVEFVDFYEGGVLQMLGRGRPQNRRYGEQAVREPYEPVKVPEGTVFKKIDG